MPEIEDERDDDSDADADCQKQTVGGEPDQGDGNDDCGHEQGHRAANGNPDHFDTSGSKYDFSLQPRTATWQATRSGFRMQNISKTALEMHTLLVCADGEFLGAAREVLHELQVTPRIVADCESAIALIQEYEFDTIIVDWREIMNLREFFEAVQRSKLNQECVLVAIVHDLLDVRGAFAAGVLFLIHKPASAAQIERCLRAAYSASVTRRRKRHRESVNIMASISTRTQPFAEVTIANLSERGARVKAVRDPGTVAAELSVGVEVDLRFALPESNEMLQCSGSVVWTSPDGDSGLQFSHIADRRGLEQWLTACVERSRAELCQRLRAACA